MNLDKSTNLKGGPVRSVQIMRGIAAVSVVAFHSHVILAKPEYGGLKVFGQIADKGWMGVNFFFVLSGFIIFLAHEKDIGKPSSLPLYYSRRFTRLYPVYWILLTAFIAAAAIGIGHPDFKWDAAHFITAYTLIPIVDHPTLPLKVAWTLLFEIKFYLIFSLLLISKRIGIAALTLWAAAIIGRNLSSLPPPDWGNLAPDWGLLHIWNINFLFGMLSCVAVQKLRVSSGPWILVSGIALLIYLASYATDMETSVVNSKLMAALGLAFALIIVGGVLSEAWSALKSTKWAEILGDASFSIYLVHSAAISQVASFNFKIAFGMLPPQMVYCVAFFTSVAAGIIVHFIIELPLLRYVRSIKARSLMPLWVSKLNGSAERPGALT